VKFLSILVQSQWRVGAGIMMRETKNINV